jgi:hypothetical protein
MILLEVYLLPVLTGWSLRAPQFDRIVVDRLFALSEHDNRMAARVKKTFEEMKGKGIEEADVLQEQIDTTRKQIARYDFLLTNPSIGLDVETAQTYAASLAELRPKLTRLLLKQKKRPDIDPETTIKNFYFVLSHLTTEFFKQGIDVQKQMMTKLVQQITVERLSPHLYSLYIIWQDGVARRPDIALLWRAVALRGKEGWSTEEDTLIKTLWPTAHPLDVLRHLPERSRDSIANRAIELGVNRTFRTGGQKVNPYHRSMTYADLAAAMQRVNKEDEEYICGILNDMAEKTKRGEILAYWPLPIERVGFSTMTTVDGDDSVD